MALGIDILIRSKGELDQLDQTNKKVGLIVESVGKAQASFNALATGIVFDVGRRINDALAEIPKLLKEAVEEGIRFNATMESSQRGIAAFILASNPGIKSFQEAISVSAVAMEELSKQARLAGAPVSELSRAFEATTVALTRSGASIQQQIDLIGLIAKSTKITGLPAENIPLEARSLVTGLVSHGSFLARALNITPDEIKAAKDAGTLLEFLQSKLDAFVKASEGSTPTFNGLVGLFRTLKEEIFGKLTEPIFARLKEAIDAVNKALKGLIDSGKVKELSGTVADFIGVFIQAFKDGNLIQVISLTIKAGIQEGSSQIGTLIQSSFASSSPTILLIAARVGLEFVREFLRGFEVIGETIATLAEFLYQKFREASEEWGDVQGKILEDLFNFTIKKINSLSQFGRNHPLLFPAAGLIPQLPKVEYKPDDTFKAEDLSEIFIQRQKEGLEAADGLSNALSQQIDQTEKLLAATEKVGDGDKTVLSYNEELKKLLEKQKQIRESMEKLKEPEDANNKRKLNERQQIPGFFSTDGPLADKAKEFYHQLGDQSRIAGQVIQGTLGNAINGVSAGISGLITGTRTWGDAMRQTGIAIIEAMVQIGVEMVAHAALSKVLQAAGVIQAETHGAAIAASYAPAAATAGAATFGVGTVAGVALTVAAIGAAIAALAGAFAEGGLIPGAPSSRDNRLAFVASGEYVTRTAAVSHYGPAFFEALNNLKIPKEALGGFRMPPRQSLETHFATGGLVGPTLDASSMMPDINVEPAAVHVAFVKDPSEVEEYLQSRAGKKIIIRTIQDHKHQIGVVS